jgi:UDP-N-acetylglucosamine 1-carboxyvinyltransferase
MNRRALQILRIVGGVPLAGTIRASGSKNAALPIMAAAILGDGPVMLSGVPELADVNTLALLLGHLGLEAKRDGAGMWQIATVDPRPALAEFDLVGRMRASFCVLGPLLARRGRAIVSLPGGCAIGARPVDLHLKGLAALGADLRIDRGYVLARAKRLHGARISLSGRRGPTVTGTANVMAAATLARGYTTITGAACEPEIVDLGNFLIAMGAKIEGLGTATIEVTGVEQLGGAAYRVIPDRIEAATLLIAAAMTRGSIRVTGVVPNQLTAVLTTLESAGADLEMGADQISLAMPNRPRPFDVATNPYPGIPTDLQAQLMAFAALGTGASRLLDRVFPERFKHVPELIRMGARIDRRGDSVIVTGVDSLTGGNVVASDLRASAALVLAGLAARGTTIVRRIDHLDRGYEGLDAKLTRLGARIERLTGEEATRTHRESRRSPPALAPLAA